MILKSSYKIDLYCIMFRWRTPRSSGKSSLHLPKHHVVETVCLVMRTQLDPLRFMCVCIKRQTIVVMRCF